MSIRKVALAGATGNIGLPLLTALLGAGFHVTALTRDASTIKLPQHPNVKAVSVDYSNHENLKAALKGINAVISAIAFAGFAAGATPQTNLIHAAAEAGVKRFLPSEFGAEYDAFADNSSPLEKAFAGDKLETRRLLKELSKKYSDFSYTFICTGVFLDWGLQIPWLLVTGPNEVTITDDGNIVLQATTLKTIGKAVVAVMSDPEKGKNRTICVKDVHFAQQ